MTMTFNRIIGWSVAMVAALCAVDPASAGCWGTIRTCPDVNADQAKGGKKKTARTFAPFSLETRVPNHMIM